MTKELLANLGPLAHFAGKWEGEKGIDISPADDRPEIETNKYREVMEFEPFGPVNNHEQQLWGLRYALTAWRIGEKEPFHEDKGYWLWDASDRVLIKSFVVPRGVAVIAGGHVNADAKSFTVSAKLGSEIYGVLVNPFLSREFKITAYDVTMKALDANTISYEQDTQLLLKGQKEIFHHTDSNTLRRVAK